MTLTLRQATPDDADTMVRFIGELAAHARKPDAVEVTPDQLRAHLQGPEPAVLGLLAQWDERPVGLAVYFYNYSTWRGRQGIYLEDLYVAPEYRNQGVGAALMAGLAQLGRQRNCVRLEWAVLDFNTRGQAFYERLGAQRMNGWLTYRLADGALQQLADRSVPIEGAAG